MSKNGLLGESFIGEIGKVKGEIGKVKAAGKRAKAKLAWAFTASESGFKRTECG